MKSEIPQITPAQENCVHTTMVSTVEAGCGSVNTFVKITKLCLVGVTYRHLILCHSIYVSMLFVILKLTEAGS